LKIRKYSNKKPFDEQEKNMSRSSKNKLLVGITALAILAGGIVIVQLTGMGDAIAQGEGGEMPPMPVPYVVVEEKPVQLWKEFSARLQAVDYVEIRPQVSGIIQKIHFEDGQIVKKGDILYTIDPRPYEAAVAQARSEVAAAKDDAEFAQKELARAEELLKTGAISKQGYDERVNNQKVNKSGSAGANARLKAALVDLDHTTIEAPIDGRISRPEITEGNLVNAANAPLLTTIVSEAEIYADFEVDEQTYLTFVRGNAGQTLEAEKAIPVRLLLKNDDKPYEGTIKSFDNKINPSSGTIRVRAIFANDDGALLPGMFARAQIGSSTTENKITITEKAIQTDQSRKYVYVVGEDNAATYREVKPSDSVNGERIILSGLKPGDKVIIDNLMKIRPGAKVQPMTPDELKAMKEQMAAQTAGGGAPAKAEEAKAPEGEEATPATTEASATENETSQPIPFEEPAEETATVPIEQPAAEQPVQE
jgi:multidrug efflux system membrane fusion protein